MQNVAAVSHLQILNPFSIPLIFAAHGFSSLSQQKSRLKI